MLEKQTRAKGTAALSLQVPMFRRTTLRLETFKIQQWRRSCVVITKSCQGHQSAAVQTEYPEYSWRLTLCRNSEYIAVIRENRQSERQVIPENVVLNRGFKPQSCWWGMLKTSAWLKDICQRWESSSKLLFSRCNKNREGTWVMGPTVQLLIQIISRKQRNKWLNK